MIEFKNIEIKYGDYVAIDNLKFDNWGWRIFYIPWAFWLWKDNNTRFVGI